MPIKPENTSVSDKAFQIFIDFAVLEGFDMQYVGDWIDWFKFFEKGYVTRMEEK